MSLGSLSNAHIHEYTVRSRCTVYIILYCNCIYCGVVMALHPRQSSKGWSYTRVWWQWRGRRGGAVLPCRDIEYTAVECWGQLVSTRLNWFQLSQLDNGWLAVAVEGWVTHTAIFISSPLCSVTASSWKTTRRKHNYPFHRTNIRFLCP